MKPSYREHYVNLAVEQNRTKSLASEQLITKAAADNRAPGKFSGESAEEINDIGSEECGVNVFEDGTILEDVHGEAAGQSSSKAIHPSFPLDQQAITGEEEEEEDHVEEGGKEENDDEEEEGMGETEVLEKEEEALVGETILAKEEIIKEEEDGQERQDTDPLDMEVSDETFNEEVAHEQATKLPNLGKTLMEERRRGETLIEERMRGETETLVEERSGRTVEDERGRISETAEEAAARELDEATLSIADPNRGERERQ